MKTPLSQDQINQVKAWADQGLELPKIQSNIAKHFHVHLTEIDTRFLIDNLNVESRTPEKEKAPVGLETPEPTTEPSSPIPNPRESSTTRDSHLASGTGPKGPSKTMGGSFASKTPFSQDQIKQIKAWADQGLKLSIIQSNIAQHFDVHLTYLDTRFLIDDLSIELKEPEKKKPPVDLESPELATEPLSPPTDNETSTLEDVSPESDNAAKKVTVSTDPIQRPGRITGGTVTFSDGITAEWQIDNLGQLGLISKQKGYQPPPADIPEFEIALQKELQKQGIGG